MDEIMYLINGIDLNAAEITQSLARIGDGSMQDGLNKIVEVVQDSADACGYKRRLIEEALEASDNDFRKKLLAGGLGILAGVGITAGSIWLYKKLRKKKERKALEDSDFVNLIDIEEVPEGENDEEI